MLHAIKVGGRHLVLLLALGLVSQQPLLAAGSIPQSGAGALTTAATQPRAPDQIRLSLYGARRTPNLFWRIDASGKGEIATPLGTGYQVAVPLIMSPAYKIAPGLHSFDIGAAGYAELRTYLGQIIEGKLDRAVMTNGQCAIENRMGGGSVELDWTSQSIGEFHLPHDCLNGTGQYFHDHMLLAWHKLASLLHEQGQSIVTVERVPARPMPAMLRFTKVNAWTGATTVWQIDKNGKGWVDFSNGTHLPTLVLGTSNYAIAGRHHFRLGQDLLQALVWELDPYLSGKKTSGSCEDEIAMTDQPIVRIEWQSLGRTRGSFRSDMGCPSFAARFGKVELAFAELLRSGVLGDSRILTGK